MGVEARLYSDFLLELPDNKLMYLAKKKVLVIGLDQINNTGTSNSCIFKTDLK